MHAVKAALCAALILISPYIIAHPHSWVNVTSDFVINENGALVEVRQRWIFDAFYSAITLDDLRKQFPTDQVALKVFSEDVVNNMERVNYFSNLRQGSRDIPIKRPYKWNLSTFTIGDEELLVLEMLFKVPETSLTINSIEWSVFDPTYYVDMRHDDINKIRIINVGSSECQPELNEPNPTDEQILYAASLDVNQKDTAGLGQVFAQKVTLSCF